MLVADPTLRVQRDASKIQPRTIGLMAKIQNLDDPQRHGAGAVPVIRLGHLEHVANLDGKIQVGHDYFQRVPP
jgi:hypothetical protein